MGPCPSDYTQGHGEGSGGGDSHVSELEDRVEEFASDESSYEFERSIRELLPGLKEGESSLSTVVPKGVRKSERHKKPSSRWNKEAGFVPEPPRSTKKKGLCEDASAGTPSVPLALADWSNAQIVKYCNACGISFDCSVGHVDACIDYIRNVEKNSFLDWCYLQCGEGGDLLGGPRQLDCFFMNIIS